MTSTPTPEQIRQHERPVRLTTRNRHTGGWTPERIDVLRTMWIAGESCAHIAAVLGNGITRSAVIGKAHRERLNKTHPHPQGHSLEDRMRRSAEAKAKRLVKDGVRRSRGPHRLAEPIPKAGLVSLMDLTTATCRYPIGDPRKPGFGFCGKSPAAESSYCAEHKALCTRRVAA